MRDLERAEQDGLLNCPDECVSAQILIDSIIPDLYNVSVVTPRQLKSCPQPELGHMPVGGERRVPEGD